MFDRFSAARTFVSAAGHDGNIPQLAPSETQALNAWAVTLDASAFLALLVAPLVVISGMWQDPDGAVVLLTALGVTRRSQITHKRVRLG
ncbi:hypothetical protein [Streptomyces flavidovirens]